MSYLANVRFSIVEHIPSMAIRYYVSTALCLTA